MSFRPLSVVLLSLALLFAALELSHEWTDFDHRVDRLEEQERIPPSYCRAVEGEPDITYCTPEKP